MNNFTKILLAIAFICVMKHVLTTEVVGAKLSALTENSTKESEAVTLAVTEYDMPVETTGAVEVVAETSEPVQPVLVKKSINVVPLMDQNNYGNVQYGRYGSVAADGCGIVVVAMIASYMLDDMTSPADLAAQFGRYNTEKGSDWALFENSAEELGLGSVEETTSWSRVEEALKNGQMVVCSQAPGLFTKTGHFILLKGLTEGGKILVNDPNGENYQKPYLASGFKNGFTKQQIHSTAKVYFIYEAKSVACTEISEMVAP